MWFISGGMCWGDDEAPELRLEKMRIHFSKKKDSLYFSMPTEPGETNKYFFAEFKVEEDRAVVWVPDFDVFEQRIEEGTISGTNSSNILLDSPPDDILKLITTNALAFNYKEPILLRKLK